jgi:hypothetical protein
MRHIQRIEPAMASSDRQLQEAASELAVEAVWTLIDARRFDAGENVGRLALELARRSDSTDAQSCAYSALTAANIERGIVDRALMYSRGGVQLPEVPEGQQAWMRIRKGWSLALVRGQERAARDELESLQSSLREQVFPGHSLVELADMMGDIGAALNGMGAYAEAHDTLDEAITLLGNSSPYLESRCIAQKAMAALRMSELPLAAGHILDLAHVVPLVNSRRLDDYLRDVLAESTRWATVPEIREARDHLKSVAILQ